MAKTDKKGQETVFEYDALGRLTKVIDEAEGETTYTYDERGHKLTETDAKQQTTTWGYDALGRKVRRTLHLGQTETWTYLPGGQVHTHTDFDNKVTTYTYDDHNRVSRIDYNDGSAVTYTYDVMGRQHTVTDPRGVTTYTYDNRGRVTSVIDPDNREITYTYDNNGNKRTVTTANGTTTTTYDQLNRIATVTDTNGTTTYTYGANGRQATLTYPNGTVAEYDYDSLGRVLSVENRTASDEIITYHDYTLDLNGNRTRIEEANGRAVDYAYDALNRVVSETITQGSDEQSHAYTYDSVGNTLSKTTCLNTTCETTTYTYNQNNQLITETTSGVQTQYFYDASGNTVEQTNGTDVVIYDYDDQNRLIYLDTGTSIISYEYDAKGIRVAKTVDGEEQNYLVDHLQAYAQVLEETDAAGVLQARYTQGNDLLTMNRGSDVSYYHYDALGSTRALTDASGVLTDVYDYEAYGEILQSSGTTTNGYLFAGEARDAESGNYYLRARYYDPSMGRFVTRDTWPGDHRRPMSLNKYIYTEGNPVVFVDPSGHWMGTLGSSMTALAVVGILSTIAEPSFAAYSGVEAYWWRSLAGRYKALQRVRDEKGWGKAVTQYANWAVNSWMALENNLIPYQIWAHPEDGRFLCDRVSCEGKYNRDPLVYFNNHYKQYSDYKRETDDKCRGLGLCLFGFCWGAFSKEEYARRMIGGWSHTMDVASLPFQAHKNWLWEFESYYMDMGYNLLKDHESWIWGVL